ncbi:17743_t:CDS:2 [Funneliformis caledonium]|uniref:17743_t:CDS:1 n=1 Tax=Funneliformis caledonium TaxID=1117310 RepID=A0A9N8WF49_9GLOM|nr:17743_t:CDS:2 [Funneliformis caledonium]
MENTTNTLSKREKIRIRVQIISIARRVRIARFHRAVGSQNLRVNVFKERPRNIISYQYDIALEWKTTTNTINILAKSKKTWNSALK